MIEGLRTVRLLRDLRRGARRPAAMQRVLQGTLLRRAIAHASRHVPFYQRLWKRAGLECDRIRSLDDLGRLPVVDADEVRAAAERGELLAGAAGADGYARFSTTGSSGRPLEVLRGAAESRLWRVGGLRMQLELGFHWRETTVQLDSPPGPPHPLQALGIAPTVWIPPDLPLDEQLDRLARARASVVFGNARPLRRIARALTDGKPALATPKMVFYMAEVLDADSRATIRAGFGVDPIDVYAMTEIGFIGWQCEQRACLHVNCELVVVEILDGDGVAARPGELGRVVVTDLRGRTMPLFRYDTGDLARASGPPCTCGRTLPTMGPVEGRARHAIQTADGRTLTQRAVMSRLAGTVKMDEYRLRRASDRRFVLEVTPRGFMAGADALQAQRVLSELLGDVDVRVETIDAMPEGDKTYAVIDERKR